MDAVTFAAGGGGERPIITGTRRIKVSDQRGRYPLFVTGTGAGSVVTWTPGFWGKIVTITCQSQCSVSRVSNWNVTAIGLLAAGSAKFDDFIYVPSIALGVEVWYPFTPDEKLYFSAASSVIIACMVHKTPDFLISFPFGDPN